jgi:hypothetical protein
VEARCYVCFSFFACYCRCIHIIVLKNNLIIQVTQLYTQIPL